MREEYFAQPQTEGEFFDIKRTTALIRFRASHLRDSRHLLRASDANGRITSANSRRHIRWVQELRGVPCDYHARLQNRNSCEDQGE
jgi:hypothetical protein